MLLVRSFCLADSLFSCACMAFSIAATSLTLERGVTVKTFR